MHHKLQEKLSMALQVRGAFTRHDSAQKACSQHGDALNNHVGI